ncbi:PHD finger protein 10 [Habropoda laboriosa]|uniref:PHD finger protein 10 n=1 Tax=Habropoda laboriosa TaxID=597456 RepID=A0A0L7RIF0_9HYME|nr:PHD finger protein 10 [Habropoda laboriosa]
MSESPKMGLFGSKDETKETKKEVKDDSPDRYAPYCIDSDSETYDTEALSIMDINDIIGVQSEPVSDSTLESEIAALSQMITESKTDTSQSATEIKYETTENELIKVDGVPMVENMDAVEVSDTSDRLTSTLEELEIVCSARETTSGCMEQLSKGNLQFNNENTLQESLQLCEERKDNDTRDNCEMNVLTESVAIVDSKDVENSDVISQTDGEFVQATSDSISVTSDVVKSEENVNRPNANKQGDSNIKIATVNSEVTIIESENSIRGSLQLIGEAYSSEDSEDTIMNDEEPKETSSAISSNENSLISCEEKKDAFEVCEPQQDVNNVSDDINNISSNKICTEKDIAETIESEEVYSIEVDSSNCSKEPKHAEELLTISRETEDTKDIVPNECKVDSPSNIVSQCEEKEEDVNIAASDTNNVQEELMEEKKIDIQVIVEESVLEHSDMEVDEKDVELTSGTCATEESKCEVEVTEESTDAERDQKTAECMVVEEEGSSESEECISEKKGSSSENEEPVNTLDIESNIASNDQVLSTESNDEVSADNDTKISEEKSELEIGIPKTEIQSGSIDNFTSVELDKFESPQVTDNLDVSKDEVDEVELPEEKAEMEIEKLESLETEIKQDFLKPIASQLSPEVNDEIPVVSEEDSTSALQNSTEVSSYSDNLIDTTINVADNIVTNVGMETEEKNSLDSVPSEIIKVDLKEDVAIESVDTAELSIIQEKSEDELKTCTLESCDTTFKYKDPMEVDSNEDSVTSALGTDTTSVVTQPAHVTYEESSEDKTAQPLEEIDDKKAEEMEITNLQITQDENGIVEKESQESNEIESTIVEETELDKPLDVADVITEYTESKEMEISEQHEDLKIEKATEEITIEEQVEEENIIERKAEEKVTVEKEATEEEITVEKEIVEEEVTVEKEIAEEEVTVEKHIEEKITGKNPFSLSDRTEVVVCKEDVEEEHIKEEMNLTLEPEDTQSQSEMVKSDIDEKSENEKDMEFSEEIIKEDQEDTVVKMDEDTVDSLGMEKSSAIEIDTEEPMKSDLIPESMEKDENVEDLQKDLREDTDLPENELDMDFEEAPLESVGDLEETESKLELAQDILLQSVDEGENLNDTPPCVETSQPSSEISELESAVKFLQESEEQGMDSPLILSPKLVESVVDDISKQADSAASLFVPDEDMCENASELEAELQNIATDSISISEAEIISEAAKLESERKLAEQVKLAVTMSPTTSKDSLLIQKDAKLIAYQKMLESPKLTEKQSEPKIMETPRKDSEKHDFENVGSPRIILKIAKSAIADCGEPRSPKSPKIRSATNSPNPEDSPGQKLGKIKLKLSKSGHPSIISNENIEEVGQWYSEGSSSLSPIGMKIKLSKSGDASIVSSEKHDSVDDSKEGKHKFEEIKRTESPIGMKIKLSKTGDASIVQQEMQMKHKEKLDIVQGSPKRTESPIGMKIKLSKTGDASIIQPERQDYPEEYKDNAQIKQKEKHESCYDSPKRTDSPIGMKIKLSKTGDASIVSPDLPGEDKDACKTKEKLESPPDVPKRTESPIGMKIKLAKTKGGASIISMENSEEAKDKLEMPDVPKRTESPLGMKIKLSKSGDASIVHLEVSDEYKEKVDVAQDAMKSSESPSGMKIKVIKSGETSSIAQETAEETVESVQDPLSKVESPIGMKIKLYKFGDPSIISSEKQQEQLEEGKSLQEIPKRTESPLGMKIKLSKTGDASIIQPESSDDTNKMLRTTESEHFKPSDTCLGMKIKLSKTGDASIVDPEKKDRQQRRRDTESPLEMKIKLSKTGHPTIVACDNQAEPQYKPKEATAEPSQNFTQRYKESAGQQTAGHKESSTLKMFKSGSHSAILQSNRSELTIEPVQMQGKKPENVVEISPKRKDITIAPIESKKSKLEAQLTQILPEVTIQPVTSREQQKQFLFDPKGSAISLQQMNVINQEISITQVRPTKPSDASMSEKLKDILSKNTATNSPLNSDCEIIEHRPELIIVNENSNSSQDVVIIEEVSPNRMPEVKVPKKRGRPRRNPLQQGITHPPPNILIPRGPLSLDEAQQMQQPQVPHFPQSRENERPKRTCRSRGKRKLDSVDPQVAKKPRLEQDLNAIEASTTAVIMIDNSGMQQGAFGKSPELYKALKQPTMDSKVANSSVPDSVATQTDMNKIPEMRLPRPVSNDSKDGIKDKKLPEIIPERMQKVVVKTEPDKTTENVKSENKDMLVPPGHPNWLTPMSKRVAEGATKHENVSTVQVIDEETRMSAESGSRSQTPARNISAPASETIVNEESQGSVLSTATTESEKVKVKNRRMEINFDPDEGPFTVDKIAEYEWPLDRKGETFMIQEQISQYLGVKSFKRKYPDLKRRVVDMEERNYLRENGLVSEAMCDMGLTAVCSSEVLDVMCSDFPDQYEEYRKHMREKQVKEHSKKQKELTAAANAEKNRIDLAEMAVQSALSWNISLNKARRENRKCSLDLQTFTIHVPKKQQKIETERRIGHYPVALIPGQYTDYYREYTPAELRYYPLNTVLYGPMRPNERKFDSQSEGSQSDSDSDSSSDDSSSSSSEGTQDTEGSQSTMDEVDMEIANQKDEIKLKCKMCLKTLNKHSKTEVLIQCGTCNGHVHPSCIDLTLDMVPHIQSYSWQCTDCKTCAQCHDPADEDKMLFCDMCDRGYHIYCVGLRRVPQGRWHCQECAVCANCGSREPGGVNSDRNSVALWQHEYKKGDKNTRVYVSTLCVPCSKLWRKGRYCPHCSRCHTAPRLDLEANLVHCSACDKYLHLGCVETKGVPLDRKNYLCDFCAPNRQQMMKPLISKTLRT